jgi:DNA-binding GntR family transcriptional regulator
VRLASSHEEHQGIVDAILRGDVNVTEKLLYDHIMAVHDISQAYLKSLRHGDGATPPEAQNA